MSTILETIKSYLVSLGFAVDKSSYDQANKAVDKFGQGIEEFASTATGAFGAAAAAIAAFGVAAVAGTAKFLNGLGNQEVQMEILSRQLWTTQQQAQAFNATLQAMGTNLQSLYLSPTLMKQYQELHGVALEMQTPGDYNKQIQQVQSVQLQLKQMRLEAYYSLQWIGYYFIKYMSGPISKVHDVLQAINTVIVKNMPTWTKQVAQWMASFVQAGIYIVKAIGDVWNWLVKMANYLPGWAKGIAAALAIFSVSNPFMLWTEAIGGLILLFDDFETYVHGGKAAFPQLWAQVIKITDAFQKMFKTLQANGTIGRYLDAWKTYWKSLSDVGSAIGNIILGLGHLFGLLNNNSNQNNLTNFFQVIADMGIGAMKVIGGAIEEIAGLANIVGDALQGKWGAVRNTIQDMWTRQNLANIGVISQSTVLGAKGPTIGPKSYPYMFQGSSTSTTKHVTVNANQTNHIHSNSPTATHTAVHRGFNKTLHNIRGVIQ